MNVPQVWLNVLTAQNTLYTIITSAVWRSVAGPGQYDSKWFFTVCIFLLNSIYFNPNVGNKIWGL